MKTRFSTIDILAIIAELNDRLIGMRVANVYDADHKTYLIKLAKPDHKAVLLLESGSRFHITEYDWPKNISPSGFSMKLRKHLRTRRLEKIEQLGVDRIVDFQFGSNEAAYHIILELYDRGNIVLTDYEYNILNILRPRTDESQDVKFVVREVYPLESARQEELLITEERLMSAFLAAKEGDNVKKILNSCLVYGPALIDHCIRGCGLPHNASLGKTFKLTEDLSKLITGLQEAEHIFQTMKKKRMQGYIIQKKEKKAQVKDGEHAELLVYDEFHPYLFRQSIGSPNVEFESFNKAVDEFFSKLESQKLDLKTLQMEKSVLKKLENVKKDHEKRLDTLQKEQDSDKKKASLIEMNLDLVDRAIVVVRSAIANQIDWTEIQNLVKEAQIQGDPVASSIKSLKLDTNHITVLLQCPYSYSDSEEEDEDVIKPMKVDIDLSLTAYGNARKYYDMKRHALAKEMKTIDASEKAVKQVEKKTKQTLKEVASVATINKARKTYWFEKFIWFISSENYMVIGGRDQQQNELIVKRYLSPGDLYVHADLHGASSVVIKNRTGEEVPPKTLNEAGTMAVCNSAAWDAKVVTSAWWVHHDQVSKTAPSGEYLTTGSFMIRGKKNYLPPCYLIYGFGIMFKLDETSIFRHKDERKVKIYTDDSKTEGMPDQQMRVTEFQADQETSNMNVQTDSDTNIQTDSISCQTSDTNDQTDSVSCHTAECLADTLDNNTDDESDAASRESDEQSDERSTDAADNQADMCHGDKIEDRQTDRYVDKIEDRQTDRCSGEVTEGTGLQPDGDSDDGECSFPDTSIQLQHVRGDQFKLQRSISTSSSTSQISAVDQSEISNAEKGQKQARMSAKQRRDIRKQKKSQNSGEERNIELDEETKKLPSREKDTNSDKGSGTHQPLKRGQKGKLKKIREKYKDQDDEERELKMKLLASSGSQREHEDKKGKKGRQQKQQQIKQSRPSEQKGWISKKTLQDITVKVDEIHIKDDKEKIAQGNTRVDGDLDEGNESDEEKKAILEEEKIQFTEDASIIDSLTGIPVPDDELLFSVPVCAPYSVLTNYKYKVKLTPGNTKRGKAAKTALQIFLQDKSASQREKDLLKSIKDTDLSRNFPGKVKVSAPNLQQVKQKKK